MAKTTRAARRRAVSSARRSRSSAGWYALSAVVVVLGVFLILANRSEPTAPEANKDHWHAAIGVNVCGTWLPNPETFEFSAANSSQIAGIHTHGDGLMHIHPHVTSEAGKNATVGRFFTYGGWSADKDSFTVWDNQEHKSGDKCGDAEGVVRWELNGKAQDGNIS